MASETLIARESSDAGENRPPHASPARRRGLRDLLLPLASLRLTVALFALAIFLIFAGTLAQTEMDVFEVVRLYFRTPVAWIDRQIFFPKVFFPNGPPIADVVWQWLPKGFYFPGGFLIGGAMAVNLLAAHALRFKMQVRGVRLVAGLIVVALGVVLTWLVVVAGSEAQLASSDGWMPLWTAVRWGLAALWLAQWFALWRVRPARRIEFWALVASAVVVGGLLAWTVLGGQRAMLGGASLRILWQLIEGTVAGAVLLAGCVLLFRKRAGIVLLHAGVGLMMANELVVYSLHSEGQMRLREGETAAFVEDIRAPELAVVDRSDAQEDDVTVIPSARLQGPDVVSDEHLPFDIQVVKYLQNSALVRLNRDEANPATVGAGLNWKAEPLRPGAGADSDAKVDLSSAYVKLLSKDGGKPLGTYLVSAELLPQPVAVGDKTYELGLRFKRTYKPYSVTLLDVRKDDYIGTNTPRNYSSDIRLVDRSQHEDRKIHIWMNNPLRYAGDTFYQSSYHRDPQSGAEFTTLQVVDNSGWMIPYVACMIVATGMLAQFSVSLLRFLNRRETQEVDADTRPLATRRSAQAGQPPAARGFWADYGFTAVVVGGATLWLLSIGRVPSTPPEQMQLDAFGRLPLVYEGRVKPFDTLARNSLRILSGYQTYKDTAGVRQPAIRWLLDVITEAPAAFEHKVFRIENPEVLEILGLKPREGLRYAIDEFRDHLQAFDKQSEQARKLDPHQMSVFQKKVLELDRKLRLYALLVAAFERPRLRADHMQDDLAQAIERDRALLEMHPPRAVPPEEKEAEWQPFTFAYLKSFAKVNVFHTTADPVTLALDSLMVAYAKDDASAFNTAATNYREALAERGPKEINLPASQFESYFNHVEPFYRALILDVLAFVLTCCAWFGWRRQLNRAAFWLLVLTLVVHSVGLLARIYITGRPPVTNLYSSAVFIGWGCMLLGLVYELMYKIGVGNIIASVAGFGTLLIAHMLSLDGDTMIVMQAVLDTQFWLATHVVCVTAGYATTFVAGLLGLMYVLSGVFSGRLTPSVSKDLARMTYGTVCFAMFFSFVGTVLGGLWADDSWGRFWGWDPKENGALIIVLWNALILHARWGGMVRDRGLAVLAIIGNIVTSWSWFGVNELGAGLHSYGFTEGVAWALAIFVLSQLVVVAIGLLPKRYWATPNAA